MSLFGGLGNLFETLASAGTELLDPKSQALTEIVREALRLYKGKYSNLIVFAGLQYILDLVEPDDKPSIVSRVRTVVDQNLARHQKRLANEAVEIISGFGFQPQVTVSTENDHDPDFLVSRAIANSTFSVFNSVADDLTLSRYQLQVSALSQSGLLKVEVGRHKNNLVAFVPRSADRFLRR